MIISAGPPVVGSGGRQGKPHGLYLNSLPARAVLASARPLKMVAQNGPARQFLIAVHRIIPLHDAPSILVMDGAAFVPDGPATPPITEHTYYSTEAILCKTLRLLD